MSENSAVMRIRIWVHGLLTVAVKDPSGALEMDVPPGTDVQGLLELLHEYSPVFDPHAAPIAIVGGAQAPPEHALQDGDEVHLYPIFGGG